MAGTYINPSDPSVWKTAYSVDFSTLPTGGSVSMANGANTIDGIVWNVENTANTDEFRIVNGTGLVIDPNATASDFFNNTRTAPIISTPLININPKVIWQKIVCFRVQILWTIGTIDANFETFSFGIECPYLPAAGQQWTDLLARGFDGGSGGACWWWGSTRSGTTTRATPNTNRTTDNVSCLMHYALGQTIYYTATGSGDFPTDDQYYIRGTTQPASGSIVGSVPTAVNTMSVVMAAYPNNASNAMRMSIQKLKLEYVG